MVGSAHRIDIFAPPARKASQSEANSWLRKFYTVTQRQVLDLYSPVRGVNRAVPLARSIAPKLQKIGENTSRASLSLARNLRPSFATPSAPDANGIEEVDPVGLVLSDFDNLSGDHQQKVAKSLALLWDAFIDVFGGVSAFQAASPTEQKAYIGKFDAAARRMEAARGSEAAFHYVTVELMRHYIGFLQTGSGDPKAITLARAVAPLIDLGRRLDAERASVGTKA
jgi:hypothetical protein